MTARLSALATALALCVGQSHQDPETLLDRCQAARSDLASIRRSDFVKIEAEWRYDENRTVLYRSERLLSFSSRTFVSVSNGPHRIRYALEPSRGLLESLVRVRVIKDYTL